MGKRRFKRHRGRKKKNPILRLLFIVGLALGIFLIYKVYGYTFSNNIKELDKDVTLYIPTGASYEQVLDSLKKKDVLINLKSFELIASIKSYPESIRAGKYRINNGLSNNDLVNKLRSGSQEVVQVSFNSLEWLEELAGKVSKQIEADSLSLIIAMYSLDYNRYNINEKNLSCLYLPNTYEFYWNTDAEGFVKRMILEFETYWTEERRRKAADMDLSLPEVITLASIVQKEVMRTDELPVVAGLYYNRIKKGWKLQADPTVIYALKKELNPDTVIKRVLYQDLRLESEYNTYIHEGLPPGPICLPSLRSIEAVLNYQQHDYMYMCAKEDFSGYHNFAATGWQHNANKRKWTNALNQRKIMR